MSDGLDRPKAAAKLFIQACSLEFPFLQTSDYKAVEYKGEKVPQYINDFPSKQRFYVVNL